MTYEEWYELNKNSLNCKPRSQQFSFADFIENGYEGLLLFSANGTPRIKRAQHHKFVVEHERV